MKKFLVIVCAALLCVGCFALTACSVVGGGGGEAEPEVSPELKEFGEQALAISDEVIAFVDQVKESETLDTASEAFKDLSARFGEITSTLTEWNEKIGEFSEEDQSYFRQVVLPAMSKAGSAWAELLAYL